MEKILLLTALTLGLVGCDSPTETDSKTDTLYIGDRTDPTYKGYSFIVQDSGSLEFHSLATDSLIYHQGHYTNKKDTLVVMCPDSVEIAFDNLRRKEFFVDEIALNDSFVYQWSFTKWLPVLKDEFREIY